ncbi:MAG: hypothetical protein IPJ41_04345 [Phycisphaerales bacterium]|nr:hypothetical protein [Phycisphaerales bacterium]
MSRPLDAHVVTLCAMALPALAGPVGWQYSVLNAGGQGSYIAQATHGAGLTAGYFGSGNGSDDHAAVWTGLTPDDLIDVHPDGFEASRINATSGAQHVGHTVLNGRIRAGLWTDNSAAGFVSLHPAGMRISYALGTDGEHQVGFGETSQGAQRAFMWSGDAGSAVSLHPNWATQSEAFDIGGGREVGYVETLFGGSGGYWEGSADSWTPLQAVGDGFGSTFTNCISPDGRQQGGFAVSHLSGVNWAAIWDGSTDTFRSLHPDPSLLGSTLLDTDGTYQVGYIINFGQFAALWEGTPESYVDLHSVLPDYYTTSHAFEVYTDDEGVWVAGRASNSLRGGWDAIVWHLPVPTPPTALLFGSAAFLFGARRRRG